MARYKLQDSIWFITGETLKIYASNFLKFMRYMSLPVLGQLIGMIWVFGMTFLITDNFDYLVSKFPALDSYSTFMLTVLAVALPGLLLFVTAFWQYLVAYGALNSMTEGVITTGHVYDIASHKEVITSRTPKYIALWFVFSIFTMFAIFPLLWVLGGIFFIYFILIFQVFTFEEGLPIAGYFRRSFDLIKGNFSKTIALGLILVILTYYAIPAGLNVCLDVLNLRNFLMDALIPWASSFPIESVNSTLQALNVQIITPDVISKSVIEQAIFFLAIGFTLPIRSICWTLWYKCLNDKTEKYEKKKSAKKTGK